MTEKSLEDQATELLKESGPLREQGIVSPRRQRQINKYEMPMSLVLRGTLPHIVRDDTDEGFEEG